MSQKTVRIRNITSIRKYLTIFSGIFRLTDAELDVLAEMITYQLKGMTSRAPSDPFTSSAKKQIADTLQMANPYSVNTYLQRLRNKGCVIATPEGKHIFHPWLMPKGETQIVIIPEWNLKLKQ